MNLKDFFLVFLFFIPVFLFCQRTSVGFYSGVSLGYDAIYMHNAADKKFQDLVNFNYDSSISFLENIAVMDDGDLSNFELFNGALFGIQASLPIIRGLAIQTEIQYEQFDFNHTVYQNGNGVFNDLIFGLSGLQNNNQYQIANYFWRVNYINFPFVLKLYPSNNLFVQLGAKFGFLIKAEESRVLARFNNQEDYVYYDRTVSERIVYEFFDSNSGKDNHGFDINEWPFNWSTSLISGIGYETKSFYFSLRYDLRLLDFFKEISTKEDDFFDNYNTDIDFEIYNSFNFSNPILNNNLKLHSIQLTIGYHLSN